MLEDGLWGLTPETVLECPLKILQRLLEIVNPKKIIKSKKIMDL